MDSGSKLMSAAEAVRRFVHDGDCLALGGFSTNRRAYGLVREIIRQHKTGLCVESGAAGGDLDMLIGAGCVSAVNMSYIANSGFSMVCRRFREAAEKKTLAVEDYSLDAQTIAYHGAALGLSYVPVKNMLGSDLERVWGISEEERKKFPKLPAKKFIVQDDPFHPGSKLCLIPTPLIDVAVIHVQKASADGLCRIEGARFQDEDIAIAAKHTVISCEELVPDEELRAHPELNTLPGMCVSAVVHLPFGAHPSQCFGCYDYDPASLLEYERISRTQEEFDRWLPGELGADHDAYLARVGSERLAALRVDPEAGYVRGLKRK